MSCVGWQSVGMSRVLAERSRSQQSSVLLLPQRCGGDVEMKWPLISLMEICRPKQWPTIPKTKMGTSGYPIFGANGQIGYYSEYNHEQPTILVTCRGATCGSVNVCKPKSYVTGNAMALDDLDENRVGLEFLTYALKCADFNYVITGVAQPQVIRQSLTRLQIPLPPIAEQNGLREFWMHRMLCGLRDEMRSHLSISSSNPPSSPSSATPSPRAVSS